MAVYNIIYGSTADTYGASGSQAVYANARSSTASTAANASAAQGQVANALSGANYFCRQSFFVFDTSAIPPGTGTGLFSIYNSSTPVDNVNSDTIRFREVSTVTNKIAGASLSALTLHANPGTFPTALGYYTATVSDVATIPRSSAFSVVVHTAGEENGTVPTGLNSFFPYLADQTGTTNDPFLRLNVGAWQFVGVSNVVEVTATPHALVTTGITGTLQAGDLLVACISSRIASTTSITLPTGGEWTLVSEQKNNNTLTTTSAAASGLMAYCVRGASNPNLTFTHPVAPSVAIGRIVAYRNVNRSSPKDTQTSFTTASTVAVSGTGLTTTQIEDLIVAMAAGGQEAAWSAFNATDPIGASGATSTAAPTTTWLERADSLTVTGADTSLAIFDAVKLTSGATGNLTATADMAALHVVIAGAFKIAVVAATGTGTPAGQAGAAGGAGISSSAGTGTTIGQAAAVAGDGTVSSAGVTGTGAVAAGASVVSGVGVSASVGAGALAAQAATAVSAGVSVSTGTGALAAASASASGTGVSASSGTGTLAAQSSVASGVGAVASTGTGTLAAQAATVASTGLSGSTGSGALQADAATLSGAGISVSTGIGSLVAGSAEAAGTGTAAAANSGVLVAQAATVEGVGVSASAGSGALQSGAASIAGAGLVASTGSGALVAGSATVAGEGTVIDEGVVLGTGVLVASAATIVGEGEVTGEVAPPIFIGGGGVQRPPRPFPIEGVGYGILPQLEGEAFGFVVVAGSGAGNLPRPTGVGAGTGGVAGRSVGRLVAIKAAAIGDRGQTGRAGAVLKALSIVAAGGAGTHGAGTGVITLKGTAIGRHDDDEAAIMAFLLAA